MIAPEIGKPVLPCLRFRLQLSPVPWRFRRRKCNSFLGKKITCKRIPSARSLC